MKQVTTKTLSVGCIFLVLFCISLSSLVVQAASYKTITVGNTPYALAITPDGKYAYVPNGENICVIDVATNNATGAVPAPNWPNGVAITPDGKYAYVTDTNSPAGQEGIVSVIDIATNTVTTSIIVGGNPNRGVAITPDGKYAYVTNNDGSVNVISTATNKVTMNITIPSLNVNNTFPDVTNITEPPRTITVRGLSLPQAVAITPNGEYAYVATGDGRVAVINTTKNTVTTTVTIGGNPCSLAITPNGEYAYVINDSAVVVINTANYAVTKTINGFYAPACIAIAPDGKYAYVTNYFNDSVSVINTAMNTVERTVAVRNSPYGIAITPDGHHAYVTNLAYTATDTPAVNWVGTVSVINTDANAAASTEPSAPEFMMSELVITLLITIIIVLAIIIAVKRKSWKKTLQKLSIKTCDGNMNGKKQAPTEKGSQSSEITLLFFYGGN
jgi:YVTN family beta-propeller protein